MLTLNSIKRPVRPARLIKKGKIGDYYQNKAIIQVDIFGNEDNAIDLMIGLSNYLNTPIVDLWCIRNEIDIIAGDVEDITDKVADTTWRYRAMMELKVCYVSEVKSRIGYFENVELSYRPAKH